jgi:hypothetical protein
MNLLKDTFLQSIDTDEGKKKKCDSNHILCSQINLKGTTLLSDSEMAQKSRDSILLIGARVPGSISDEGRRLPVASLF